jgi:uncharacterized membrane protein
MICLVVGVVLWSAVHFLPVVGGDTRKALIARIGEPAYKGLFSVSLVAAIALMAIGWRSAVPVGVYAPPSWGASATLPLMAVALFLFVASGMPTNVKRILRHPQLTGFTVWAAAHLLANGDRRSLVLFGGLGIWAIAMMLLSNRRDGAWVKPEPLPMSAELKPLIGMVVAFALFFFAHPYIAGVSPLPR